MKEQKRVKNFRTYLLTAIALIVIFGLSVSFWNPSTVQKEEPPPIKFALDVNPMFNGLSSLSSLSSLSPEPVRIIMAGRDYWIPRYFIDSLSDSKAVEQRGVLLFANLPDFTPRLEEKKDRSVAFKTVARLISIHIQDAEKHSNTFQGIYKNLRKRQPTLQYNKDIYSLRLELPGPTPPYDKDVYIEQNGSGEMISYIECTRDGTRRAPGCSHQFQHDGLFVDLTYRKKYLPQWREIYGKGIVFIDSFKIPPTNQKQKGDPLPVQILNQTGFHYSEMSSLSEPQLIDRALFDLNCCADQEKITRRLLKLDNLPKTPNLEIGVIEYDLNDDGLMDFLAQIHSPIYCGTAGCSLHIFSQNANETFSEITGPSNTYWEVGFSQKISNGWHDLFFKNSNGQDCLWRWETGKYTFYFCNEKGD